MDTTLALLAIIVSAGSVLYARRSSTAADRSADAAEASAEEARRSNELAQEADARADRAERRRTTPNDVEWRRDDQTGPAVLSYINVGTSAAVHVQLVVDPATGTRQTVTRDRVEPGDRIGYRLTMSERDEAIAARNRSGPMVPGEVVSTSMEVRLIWESTEGEPASFVPPGGVVIDVESGPHD